MLDGLTMMRAHRESSWLGRIVLLVVLSTPTASPLAAQPADQAEARLESTLIPGMTVWITDAGGREARARILGVSRDTVTAAAGDDVMRLRTQDITRIEARRSDSVLNGALIGAGAGAAAGLLLCSLTEPWEFCRQDAGSMLRVGALGAGIGIGIDALIRGRKTIYEAAPRSLQIRAMPILTRHARGLQISLGFGRGGPRPRRVPG
jgi:hypothetical protein